MVNHSIFLQRNKYRFHFINCTLKNSTSTNTQHLIYAEDVSYAVDKHLSALLAHW